MGTIITGLCVQCLPTQSPLSSPSPGVESEERTRQKRKRREEKIGNDEDEWACDSLYGFKLDMKTTYEWKLSIGQIRACTQSPIISGAILENESAQLTRKTLRCLIAGIHRPRRCWPGCCLADAHQELSWPETRSLVVARFPLPLLQMAKSANSQGHCKGGLWEQNCPWNVYGIPECFNSWECVSELLEDRNHVLIHQDFYKSLLSLDAGTNQISIKAEEFWNVRKRRRLSVIYSSISQTVILTIYISESAESLKKQIPGSTPDLLKVWPGICIEQTLLMFVMQTNARRTLVDSQ